MKYEVRTTTDFDDWLASLKDEIAAAAVTERLVRVRQGLFGDSASVGDRISELRIHYGAGFRVYFTRRERVIVVMLAGGSKRTQSRDIERAKSIEQMM